MIEQKRVEVGKHRVQPLGRGLETEIEHRRTTLLQRPRECRKCWRATGDFSAADSRADAGSTRALIPRRRARPSGGRAGALRCSHRYSACQVPNASRPAVTGIVSEVFVTAERAWAGMSSGPSSSCSQARDSGARSAMKRAQVAEHRRICIFLDHQAGRGVLHEHRAQPGADLAAQRSTAFTSAVTFHKPAPRVRISSVSWCSATRSGMRSFRLLRQISRWATVG